MAVEESLTYIPISAPVIISETGASQSARSRLIVGIGLQCQHAAGGGEEIGAHTASLTIVHSLEQLHFL